VAAPCRSRAAAGGRVSIASDSAPHVEGVAGSTADLDHLRHHLDQEQVWCKPVVDVIPAHSPAVEAVAPALGQALAGLVPHPAKIPIISTAHPEQGPDTIKLWSPSYWAQQARQPVHLT